MRRALDVRWALRRWAMIARIRMQAFAKRASIELAVAGDVRFGRRVRVSLDPRSRNHLELGAGGRVHDDVLILLRGGTIRLGERVRVRRGTVLNVSGELELAGTNLLSFNNIVHCAERIRIGRFTTTGEFVTIVDSRHYHDGDDFFYENVETAPVEIGDSVWLAAKCSVLMGVTIGDEAVVAAHAAVADDVPAKATVGGVPARVVRQR